MSFGFGLGDIVALGRLAWEVYKACKDASITFGNISTEVLSLHAILKEVEEIQNDSTLSESKLEGLRTVEAGCRGVLTDLQTLVEKYRKLGSKMQRTWDRMRWHSEDLVELRSRLVSNTILLSAYMSTTQLVVEQRLNTFLQEFRNGQHEASVISTNTIEPLNLDDQKTWQAIQKELEDAGITLAALDMNRKFVVDWFKTALASGAFEEELDGTSAYAASDQKLDPEFHDTSVGSSSISHRQEEVKSNELPQRDAIAMSKDSQPPSSMNPTKIKQKSVASPPDLFDPRVSQDLNSPVIRRHKPKISFLVSVIAKLKGIDKEFMSTVCSSSPKESKVAETLERLLRAGANVNMKDKDGHTLLCNLCSLGGETNMAEFLLEHGANPELPCDNGFTPLANAAFYTNLELAKLLVGYGVTVDKTFVVKWFPSVTKDLQMPKPWWQATALQIAISKKNYHVVNFLLDSGAAVDGFDLPPGSPTYSTTPLDTAIRHGNFTSVSKLIRSGADLNKVSNNFTPLGAAIETNDNVNVHILIKRGADANKICDGQWLPLDYFTVNLKKTSLPGILFALLIFGKASMDLGALPKYTRIAHSARASRVVQIIFRNIWLDGLELGKAFTLSEEELREQVDEEWRAENPSDKTLADVVKWPLFSTVAW